MERKEELATYTERDMHTDPSHTEKGKRQKAKGERGTGRDTQTHIVVVRKRISISIDTEVIGSNDDGDKMQLTACS